MQLCAYSQHNQQRQALLNCLPQPAALCATAPSPSHLNMVTVMVYRTGLSTILRACEDRMHVVGMPPALHTKRLAATLTP
jgi:hypothetical protein